MTYVSPIATDAETLIEFRGATLAAGTAPFHWDAVHAALEGGAIVADLAWLTHITMSGRHRARFLHNMATCEVKALAPGSTTFGMLVNDKGKIVQQLQVDAAEDTLTLEVGREDRDAAIAQMTRYRVADDVKFAPDDRWHVLAVVGGGALGLLRAVAPDLPELPGAWAEATIGTVTVRLRENQHRLSLPGWDVLCPTSDVQAIHDALVTAGVVAVQHAVWTALRVHAEWPEDQVDMGLDNVPLESQRLYATMNWDKGCYIGQEVIAMMHYRGRPNRHLRRLVLTGGVADDGFHAASTALAAGAELTVETRTVGRLGSVGYDPAREVVTALGVVKRKFSEEGMVLSLDGGVLATVDAFVTKSAQDT